MQGIIAARPLTFLLISFVPDWCYSDFKRVYFTQILGIDISNIQVKISLQWIPENLVDGK